MGFIHCCDSNIRYILDVYKFTKINSEQEKLKLKNSIIYFIPFQIMFPIVFLVNCFQGNFLIC